MTATLAVQDTRPETRATSQRGYFKVTRADVCALEEACERRHLATTKAVYFSLLEVANDNRRQGPTFQLRCRDLAAKAGVGTTALNDAVKTLCAAGLLAVEGGKRGLPNRWTVLSADSEGHRSAATPGAEGHRSAATSGGEGDRSAASTRGRPTSDFQEGTNEENRGDFSRSRSGRERQHRNEGEVVPIGTVTDERVQAALAMYESRVANHLGGVLPGRSAKGDAAIRRILGRFPPGQASAAFIRALDFALAREFWASKVTSPEDFERWFVQLLSGANGERAERAGRDTSATDPDIPVATHFGMGVAA